MKKCPNASKHTKCPLGNVQWHEWAEKKMAKHYQIRRPGCGMFVIWKRKQNQ